MSPEETNELLAISATELYGPVDPDPATSGAGVLLNSGSGFNRHPYRNHADAKKSVAGTSAGNCERDANHSQPGTVWFFDSLAIHRRHWCAVGAGRPGALCPAADHSQHRYRDTRSRTGHARSRRRDGDDRPADSLAS